MPDIVDAETRSRMMSGIRGKNTKPELLIRKGLHASGFRYRLHDRRLPGSPDLVFRRWNAVIFVHGCFWHGHACHLFRLPSTRPEFWSDKIRANRQRDRLAIDGLKAAGWRVATIWECALKGRTRRSPEEVIATTTAWLANGRGDLEVTGEVRT